MNFQPVEKWSRKIGMSRRMSGYDMIIGIDLLSEMILIVDCEEKVFEWQDLKILIATSNLKFKNKKLLRAVLESTRGPERTKSELSRSGQILCVDYKAADLECILMKADNLNKELKVSLQILLHKYEDLLGGSLGDINGN